MAKVSEPTFEPQAVTSLPKPRTESRNSYLETVLGPPMQLRRADGRVVSLTLPQTQNKAPSVPSYGPSQAAKQVPAETLVEKTGAQFPTDVTTDSGRKPAASSLSRATLPSFHDFPTGAFAIDCNNCGKSIPNPHYHCNICDDGDYDLCQACVDAAIHCGGEGHWLIKRFVNNGNVINSTTETIAPKKSDVEVNKEPEATFSFGVANDEYTTSERTCNCCVNGGCLPFIPKAEASLISMTECPDAQLVTCTDCPDYDLCYRCLIKGKHGHHPAHEFEPLDEGEVAANKLVTVLCKPGRDTRHAALCDGCDKVRDTPKLFRSLTDSCEDHCWYSPQVFDMPRLGLLLHLRRECFPYPPWSSLCSYL